MRHRDLGVMVVSVIALIFAWQQEGSVSLQRAFYVEVTDGDSRVHNLPQPIIADLDSDGKPEVLLLTSRDFLATIPSWQVRRSFENSYLPMQSDRVTPLASACIGLAAGFLDIPPNTTDHKGHRQKRKEHRKQFVAVVTDDYRVTLYDHSLSEMWSTLMVSQMEARLIPTHAALAILPQRVYENDQGMVVVAVATALNNSTKETSYFAFDGATGEVRWRHSGPEKPSDPSDEQTKHANSFKLSDTDLESGAMELEWTTFRGAMVGALPHAFTHTTDYTLRPFHFFRAKSEKKRKALREKRNKRASDKARHITKLGDEDDFGEIGERGRSALASRRPMVHTELVPNVLISHHEHGINVIHMFTGRKITHLGPLQQKATYHDVNDDYHVDFAEAVIGVRQVVSHKTRHGVDQVSDCLGVVYSGAPYTRDPIFNASICHTSGFAHVNALHHFLRGEDTAEDESLPDPLELGARNHQDERTQAAHPLIVQYMDHIGHGLEKVKREAVFLINSGLVTSLDPVHKRVKWRVETESSFDPANMRRVSETSVDKLAFAQEDVEATVLNHPHLATYSKHAHGAHVGTAHAARHVSQPYILVVGDTMLTVVGALHGTVEAVVDLDAPTIAPALVGDFNGDGTNDVLLVSKGGYYGLLGTAHKGSSVISVMMLLTVALLALLYASRTVVVIQDPFVDASKLSKRSTD